ncbi:MAG: hypothetical protein WCI43_07260 [Candidatus Firestonebacteria bacterium]
MKILMTAVFMAVFVSGVFPAEKLVLFDFENEHELKAVRPEGEMAVDPWVLSCEISGEYATTGSKSLKVLPKAGAKWLVFSKLPVKDWSAYDFIKFDVFSPVKNRLSLSFVLADWQALPCIEEYKCLGYPVHMKAGVLKYGKQTLEFSLKRLGTMDSRFMHVEDTRKFAIGFSETTTPFYIDNIRLEKKDPAAEE